jgi:hypothetical protein
VSENPVVLRRCYVVFAHTYLDVSRTIRIIFTYSTALHFPSTFDISVFPFLLRSSCITVVLRPGRPRVRIPAGPKNLCLFRNLHPGFVQWVPGFFPKWAMKLFTEILLDPRLRMTGALLTCVQADANVTSFT